MPVYPIRHERVLLLGGMQERTNVLALPANISPGQTVNMRMKDIGALRSIEGFTTLDADDTATDTGATSAAVVGMFEYKSRSGGSITRRLVRVIDDGVNELEIWHSTDGGASWSFLADLGSSAVGLRPSATQYENTMILTFGGAIAARSYNGTAVSTAGQTQPDTPTVAQTPGVDGPLNGTYFYKVAEIDDDGEIGPASASSTEITITDGQVTVTFTASGGGTNGVRVFRTLGDGFVFFRVADIDDNTATTFTDNVADTKLLNNPAEVTNIGDAPPTGITICETHGDRVYYARTNANPNHLYYSDIANPDSVGVNNFERVGAGQEGDQIVAVKHFGEILAIFKERSIWTLQGHSRANFALSQSEASFGTVSNDAVVRVPPNARFNSASGEQASLGFPSLAYIGFDRRLRAFSGYSDVNIGNDVQGTLNTMDYGDRALSFAFRYPPYDWIVFAFSAGGNGYCDTYVAWDYIRGWFFEVDFWPTLGAAVLSDSATASDIVFAGQGDATTGAETYQLFTGNDADGSNITATVRTKGLDQGIPHRSKVYMDVDPIVEALGSAVNLSVVAYRGWVNGSPSAFVTKTASMQGTNVDAANPGPLDLANTSGLYPEDEAITYEFQVVGQTEWELRGWTTGFQVLPAVPPGTRRA